MPKVGSIIPCKHPRTRMVMRIFTALLSLCFLATAYMPAAQADGYSKGYDQETLDEPAARRALAEIPGFKMDEVWFATGLEDYYKSPSCVTGRDLFIFTKPEKSSPGLWRGKKSFFMTRIKSPDNVDCSHSDYSRVYAVDSGSFIDPDTMRPEEALDGEVPGIFEMRDKISDGELLGLAKDIETLYTCLNKSNCPYTVDLKYMGSHAYEYKSAVKLKNLLSIAKTEQDAPACYTVMSAMEVRYGGLVVIEICYSDSKVSKVTMSDMVTE